MSFKKPESFKYYIPSIYCILGVAGSAVLGSRSFILGYGAALCFALFSLYNFRVSLKQITIAGLAGTVAAAVLMIFVKTDSSLGRLLIYKISLKMLGDHYVHGVGWGRFFYVYREYQEAYFSNGHYTIKELLLADNTGTAFNDYLQFVIEGGLLGALILIAVFLFLVISVRKALRGPQSSLLIVAISQLIALSVAAMFMHVFERPVFQALAAISISIIAGSAFIRTRRLLWSSSVSLLAILAIAWFHYGFRLMHYKSYERYDGARELFQIGYLSEACGEYRDLYPVLKDDIGFLSDYSTALSALGEDKMAVILMQQLVKKNNSSIFYTKLAERYVSNGNYPEAERAYRHAINMVPNRFISRYGLFLLYQKTSQLEKARMTGQEIMQLPVKIPSDRVKQIRESVRKTLLIIK